MVAGSGRRHRGGGRFRTGINGAVPRDRSRSPTRTETALPNFTSALHHATGTPQAELPATGSDGEAPFAKIFDARAAVIAGQWNSLVTLVRAILSTRPLSPAKPAARPPAWRETASVPESPVREGRGRGTPAAARSLARGGAFPCPTRRRNQPGISRPNIRRWAARVFRRTRLLHFRAAGGLPNVRRFADS